MTLSITTLSKVTGSNVFLDSDTFAPSAGAILLVANFAFVIDASCTATIADTFGDSGGGIWTAFSGSVLTTPSAFSAINGGWYRLVGPNPNVGTITVSYAGFSGGHNIMCVDQVTTTSGQLSVPHSNTNDASFSATGSVSLPAPPAATSLLWSTAQVGATVAVTAAPTTSGWTSLDEEVAAGDINEATAYINGSGTQIVTWGGLDPGQVNSLTVAEVGVTVQVYLAPRPFIKKQNVMGYYS